MTLPTISPTPGLLSCSQSGQGWQEGRSLLADLAKRQIVSLWDMLEFSADLFLSLRKNLAALEGMCDSLGELEQKGIDPELEASFKENRDSVIALLKGQLEALEFFSASLGLRSPAGQIERIRLLLVKSSLNEDVGVAVKVLQERVEDELRHLFFLYVPSNRVDYLKNPALFGKGVARSSRLSEDIAEAGKCFALRRYTATAFHLMRVMEVCVRRLAKKLGLTSVPLERPWGNILHDIDNAINQLPSATPADRKRRDKFSGAAIYLRHVKNAWRNDTMHPKKTYTEEEAEHLFANVRTFVQSIVGLR